ncbi:MAG: CotH kinase family protein [Cyclobacteriaceae bacterium]
MNGCKSFLFLTVFAIATCCGLQSCEDNPKVQGPFAVDIGNSEIPYVIIDTHGGEIQFEPKIAATLQVYEGKSLVQENEIGIEYRGKTSFRLSDKKGFNIETTEDAVFFGFPEEEDFRLVGHIVNLEDRYIFDRTLMYNFVGYEIARSIGRYASRCKFIELQVNGDYLGVYVFMEKLKRDDNRINIKSLNASSTNLTGGYIITIDKTSVGDAGIGKPLSYFENNWDDDARYTTSNSFRSRFDIFGNEITFAPYGAPYHPQQYLETYFLYEYPKEEDITQEQKNYIAKYIDDFEVALLSDDFQGSVRTYTDYIDLSTFVDYFILNELFRNVDAYRLSTYLQKDRDGKLGMGPVWDLDIAFDNGDRIPLNDWVINYNNHVSQDPWMVHFWWPRLMEDPQFRKAVKARWNELRGNQLSDNSLAQWVDDTAQWLKVNGAVSRNYQVWDKGIGVDYDGSINNLKNFLQQRASWMGSVIATF